MYLVSKYIILTKIIALSFLCSCNLKSKTPIVELELYKVIINEKDLMEYEKVVIEKKFEGDSKYPYFDSKEIWKPEMKFAFKLKKAKAIKNLDQLFIYAFGVNGINNVEVYKVANLEINRNKLSYKSIILPNKESTFKIKYPTNEKVVFVLSNIEIDKSKRLFESLELSMGTFTSRVTALFKKEFILDVDKNLSFSTKQNKLCVKIDSRYFADETTSFIVPLVFNFNASEKIN